MPHIKSRLIKTLGPLGGYSICRRLTRGTPKVLMYHRFSDQPASGMVHRDEFRQQIDYLCRHFNIMRMDEVLEAMVSDPASLKNAAVITVDDGYLDFYEIAFPILRDAGLPATLFLTTRFADGNFWLWPDKVRYILEKSKYIESFTIECHEQGRVHLDKDLRDALWMRIVAYLLRISDREKHAWIHNFSRRQCTRIPAQPSTAFRGVNWGQVREMSAANIEIAAHTRTHPSLSMLDKQQLQDEVQGSVDDIELQTGRRPVSFCFPNGQPDDYTDLVKIYVKKAGCKGAVVAFYDKHITDDPYEIRRFAVGGGRFGFEKSINGVTLLAARWFNSSNLAINVI